MEPTTGESLCAYLPRVDGECLEAYLEHLGKAYTDQRVVLVLDNAPSHTSKEVVVPENVELLPLRSYSPELNPVERWFQEFRRRALSNRVFESVEALHSALSGMLEPYWRDPRRLRSLSGFPWWTQAIETLGHQ